MAIKYKTYDEFEKAYLGKAVDYDHTAGVQCVDLADQYLKDCFDITGVWVSGARELYSNFEKWPAMVKNFDKIKNSRSLIAQKGDIVVWNGGTWGHVAICDGKGNVDWFESIEQNTLGKHEPTQKVVHYYNKRSGVDSCYPVAGVLRPKDQDRIQGKFKPYIVKVTAKSGLNMRTKPGTGPDCVIKGVLAYGSTCKIYEEQMAEGSKWGKISNGYWICLKYTVKV